MNASKRLEWLAGGGEMAALIASIDWARSPLGPIEAWPQSLRTTVSLCLASNFPINIIWGDGHNQIYNDGYRLVCGAAHPRAMGEDYRVTWASAWPAIGAPFERALAGETTYLENQRMFLERNGYPEETFFTFSLSPIRDETGKVAGLFHPVTETTKTMLAERRTRALRDIADRSGRATVLADACDLLLATLEVYAFDLPFALLYLTSPDETEARLHGRCGVRAEGALAPERVALDADAAGSWPFRAATEAREAYPVEGLAARFGAFDAGPYPEPPTRACVLPVRVAGLAMPLGYLVVGVSPRLPCDDAYRVFLAMLGAATTAALANARAYEAERRRAEALAELDQAKTAFFSNVSHEFRTPLTLMLGPLEGLLAGTDGALAAPVRHELEVVHRNALRLLKLVNALLDFARIEAGRAEAVLAPTDLAALTRDVASAFRAAVEAAGMRLVVDAPPLPQLVPVDREMWEKIVLNLVSNAFKFTRAGEIRVTLRRVGAHAELAVEDSGIGIPDDEIDRVFDRFHRVRGASGRTHEGTGIGLALVKDLTVLHGGTVEVASAVGQGTTFRVRIPLNAGEARFPSDRPAPPAEPADPADRQRIAAFVGEAQRWLPTDGASAPLSPVTASAAPRPRILLADDNADMRDYVRRLLEAAGYDVTPVADGFEALRAAEASPPDLVLSDLMMPRMDGGELVKELRARPSLVTTPVILLSARAGDDETASGLALGADDYLVKPFATKELLARVRSQLSMVALRRRIADEQARADERNAVESELRRAVELRDQFLSIASHELRTPLTSLRLQVSALQRSAAKGAVLGSDKVAPRLASIDRQVERMTKLVSELLEVSRLTSGRVELDVEEVDLAQVVNDVVARLKDDAAAARCALSTNAAGPVVGRWDRLRVDQILTNFVGNALKYGAGRPIEIAAHSNGAWAHLSVRDHGIGIAAEDHTRIFDRFTRAASPESYGGFGLGLWVVKLFAEAMGGAVTVESQPGAGARFTLALPTTEGALAPNAAQR